MGKTEAYKEDNLKIDFKGFGVLKFLNLIELPHIFVSSVVNLSPSDCTSLHVSEHNILFK